jgi:hypothetical protein
MILEKIREHAGKMSFFVISALLIIIGAMYLNQRNQVNVSSAAKQQNPNYTSTSGNANNAVTKNQISNKAPASTTKVS